jgi:hypothetical protein
MTRKNLVAVASAIMVRRERPSVELTIEDVAGRAGVEVASHPSS